MTEYVFPPAPQSSLAVAGSEQRFPIRRIYCVGRNYAAHARELGNDERDPPFFFSKPADAVVENNSTIDFPSLTKDLHFEMELVVAIAKGGKNIPTEDALDHIYGYSCGIDLTRRDLQSVAKAARRPWDLSKSFDQSAPMAPLHCLDDLDGHLSQERIWLKNGDDIKQDGDLAEQIWTVPEIISHLSSAIELQAGDLIMTGTPAGVGPVQRGETLEGGVEGLTNVKVTFAA